MLRLNQPHRFATSGKHLLLEVGAGNVRDLGQLGCVFTYYYKA